MGAVLGRHREIQVVRSLLDRAATEPAALIIDGPAGIGKTTLCRVAVEQAAERGFAVLTASGAATEVTLTWSVLADLLVGVDEEAMAGLSALHRGALLAVSNGLDEQGGDERLLAAAFRSVLELQSARRPLVIVIDDAQWVDEASRVAVGFAVRRLTGRVGVLTAYRTEEPDLREQSWGHTSDPTALTRLTLGPLAPADLRAMVSARYELPGRTLSRIEAVSGGNPLYALELARAVDQDPDSRWAALPSTLAALVRDRIGEPDPAAAEAMMTAAVASDPTVDVVAAALGQSPAGLIATLEPMESRGVVSFDGSRIRFAHPLIASAVIAEADPAKLRNAHRRLAAAVDNPEQRARHLALSSPNGDPDTLAALDAAAETVSARGIYTTAAELMTLAIDRGGDNQFRRLRGAEFLFRAGRLDDAEALIAPVVDDLPPGFMRTVGLMLLAAIRGYRDGFATTAGLLQRAVAEAGEDLMLRTQASLLLATALGVGGDMAASVDHARRAREDAERTGIPDLIGQALAVWVSAGVIYGLGLDSEAMVAALEIGDPGITAPVMFRPSTVHAQTCGWTGRLEEARAAMSAIAERCAERGNELDVVWAAEQLALIEVALGCYADAERTAAGALRRAEQTGGTLPLINGYTAVAAAAAHRGRLDETRVAVDRAVAAATAGRLDYLIRPPLMSLAFAQVSAEQYDAALETMKPLLSAFDPEHDTEIMVGGYLPDAVHALVATGRTGEAEPIVEALEANGIRHDRPWMLATGARCRALVLAAGGDRDGAIECAERAMQHHERLPMPFERARTQLLLGQLQRRRRRIGPAAENIEKAAEVFEAIGSPLWAQRARRELNRLTARSPGAALTDTERQVAELAASGLTNKAIATHLYMSAKTVEMHLSNAYRKLGIRSRAQLADRLRG